MSKEKITISDIIDLMVKNENVGKTQADEFVRTLISTIEDELLSGENVKIKGLGVFKPQWNEARLSKDENTGNEIIIPGFYDVIFTPDDELKETINEPFAHLEPILLDQGDKTDEAADGTDEKLDSNLGFFSTQAAEIKEILSDIHALSGKRSRPVLDEELDAEEPEKNVSRLEPEAFVDYGQVETASTDDELSDEAVDNVLVGDEVEGVEEVEEVEEELSNPGTLSENDTNNETQTLKSARQSVIYIDDFDIVRDLSLLHEDAETDAVVEDLEQNISVKQELESEEVVDNEPVETDEKIVETTFLDNIDSQKNDEITDEPIEEKKDEAENDEADKLGRASIFKRFFSSKKDDSTGEAPIDEATFDVSVVEEEVESEPAETETLSEVLVPEATEPLLEIVSEQEVAENPTDKLTKEEETFVELPAEEHKEGESSFDKSVDSEVTDGMITPVFAPVEATADVDEMEEVDSGTIHTTEATQEIVSKDEVPNEVELEEEVESNERRKIPGIALVVVGSLVVVGIAAFFLSPVITKMMKEKKNQERLEYIADSIENLKKIELIRDSIIPAMKGETSANLAVDSTQKTLEKGKDSIETVKTQAETPVKVEKPGANNVNIYAKPRNYKEVIATEKMVVGSQLTKFARQYYNHPNFWVYIYEANKDKIQDPNNVPAGIDIKIPKMDARLIDPKNKESMNYALKLQGQYLK